MTDMSALAFVTIETHKLSQFYADQTRYGAAPPERSLEQWRHEFKLWRGALDE